MAGAVSPYINTGIKQATEGNTEANLIAHAIWGAVEAYTQGGKAGAGAAAAVTGEVGAKLISEQVFGKTPESLTEAEKKTVSELSQVAAGVAGGLSASGGNSLSTAQAVKTGQGIGKNAVENNYLSQLSQNRRDWLREQLKRQDLSAKKREQYEQEYRDLEQDDHTSDYLVAKALHNPEKMTKSDWALYLDYAKRYYLESAVSHNRPEEIRTNLNNILSSNYIRGYDYPYALAEQYRANSPSRWSLLGINKSEDEQFYSDIAKKYENRVTYENSFNGRVAKSTAEALGYAGSLVVPTSAVLSSIPKVGELARKYPTLSEMAIIGTVNTAAQLSSDNPYLYSSLIEAELSYLLTRKDSASVAWSKNMMLGSYMEQAEKQEKEIRFGIKEDPEYFKKGLGITFGALGSKGIDIGFSQANKLYSLGSYGNNLIRPTINAAWGEWSNQKISNTFDSLNKSSEEKK
ncbi:VENN motif pre-toxin domain-containing protein [Mannheimia indoligenes]|uniref:VENN motif pre-toxin domain-containing protein n=1 Tax=Mannheimia indoligenes TaxID=3103145 RepID=UPI003D16F895